MFTANSAHALVPAALITTEAGPAAAAHFPLVAAGAATPLVVSADEWPGVRRAAGDFQADVERVTGTKPALTDAPPASAPLAVLAGTVGHSALIDGLVRAGKLDVSGIRGRWEAFAYAVVDAPVPGVGRALVIAGSDKRGTIYGLYTLSEQIGVSPWAWWADVPVAHRDALYLTTDRWTESGPVVKYRGIFLNDEAPSLVGWAQEKFGGMNRACYAHIFELILRLRGNYLWPAMWNNAFNEDDPGNPALADEYGIVMGTSHHEPMARSQQEWKRHGTGPWDYARNAAVLRDFWTEGIRRNRAYESVVTLAMRGDGDMPMSADANVALLGRIVADQRAILAKELNPDLTKIPQVWALYKEVQDYYEKGMRVPDDVTLLWCDDNWGNLRRVPAPAERARAGGAGIYYHFDYVGDPRNYKWINTNPITKVWEQMHLAAETGATRLWIVNVGDLKPMEFPIEFFLTYAWDPARWSYGQLDDYTRAWAAREFGAEQAGEIAALINGCTKLLGRRKPELLAPETFSLLHEREAERIEAEWGELVVRAQRMNSALPKPARPAFFQLVLHPILAASIVNELEITAARNRLAAAQGRASANALAARARELFQADASVTAVWDAMLGGKWKHMMDQTHLGYTSWQQPVRNLMPAVTEVQVPAAGSLGVAVEGDPAGRPGDYPVPTVAVLPPLSPYDPQPRWFDVFNRGTSAVRFSIEPSAPWLHVSTTAGQLGPDVRINVTADWAAAPAGVTAARIVVRAEDGPAVEIDVPVEHRPVTAAGFTESNRRVAIEAPHFARSVGGGGVAWQPLPDFGPAAGGVTIFPVTAPEVVPGGNSARLEYDVNLFSTGDLSVQLQCAPSLDYRAGAPLRIAVSFDDEAPQTALLGTGENETVWRKSVADNYRRITTHHAVAAAGHHVLKVWAVSPGMVIERIVIHSGALTPTFLGPVESLSLPAR